MIVEERMETFLNALAPGNADWLDALEREAKEEGVPVIRRPMQNLLRFLLAALRPRHILEVGTATGFSALLMREYAGADCRITTIEKQESRIARAREHLKRYDPDGRITLLPGDAAERLRQLEPPFDLIFMDAAKGQYLHFLPDAVRLLRPGGLLVSDNVLQEGSITESRYAITRRDRTIHSRMREYLYTLTHHAQLDSIVLPVGDGAAVSVKRGEQRAGSAQHNGT